MNISFLRIDTIHTPDSTVMHYFRGGLIISMVMSSSATGTSSSGLELLDRIVDEVEVV